MINHRKTQTRSTPPRYSVLLLCKGEGEVELPITSRTPLSLPLARAVHLCVVSLPFHIGGKLKGVCHVHVPHRCLGTTAEGAIFAHDLTAPNAACRRNVRCTSLCGALFPGCEINTYIHAEAMECQHSLRLPPPSKASVYVEVPPPSHTTPHGSKGLLWWKEK